MEKDIRADRRSDVYSLGVILFELLTGELPFRGDARMLIVQILNEEPPSPRKLKGERFARSGNDHAQMFAEGPEALSNGPGTGRRSEAIPQGRTDPADRSAGPRVPGGGAGATPIVATLSAALLAMLLGVSIGSPSLRCVKHRCDNRPNIPSRQQSCPNRRRSIRKKRRKRPNKLPAMKRSALPEKRLARYP